MSNTSAKKAIEFSKEIEDHLKTLETKSAKIRYLYGLKVKPMQIKEKLGISYQHVRNVLMQDTKEYKANWRGSSF